MFFDVAIGSTCDSWDLGSRKAQAETPVVLTES